MTPEQAIRILDSETSLVAIEELKYYAGFNRDKVIEQIQEAMDMGAEALRETMWIPCSERLPEDDKPVLVSFAWEEVDIGWYKGGDWCSDFRMHDPDYGVIAWMPLPEPYKESEDE